MSQNQRGQEAKRALIHRKRGQHATIGMNCERVDALFAELYPEAARLDSAASDSFAIGAAGAMEHFDSGVDTDQSRMRAALKANGEDMTGRNDAFVRQAYNRMMGR